MLGKRLHGWCLIPWAHKFHLFLWKLVIIWLPMVTERVEPYALHIVCQCLPDNGYQERFPLNPGESTYQTCLAKQPAQASDLFPTLFSFICSLLWQKKPHVFSAPNIFHIKFLLPRESIIMHNYNKWILCRWCIFLNLIITWQWNLLVPFQVELANFLVWSQHHRTF